MALVLSQSQWRCNPEKVAKKVIFFFHWIQFDGANKDSLLPLTLARFLRDRSSDWFFSLNIDERSPFTSTYQKTKFLSNNCLHIRSCFSSICGSNHLFCYMVYRSSPPLHSFTNTISELNLQLIKKCSFRGKDPCVKVLFIFLKLFVFKTIISFSFPF